MSFASLALALGLSLAIGGIAIVSVWVITDALDDRRDMQNVFEVALAYRDHMTSSRCTLPTTALAVNTVRTALTNAGISTATIEDESSWRITYDGGVNRQMAVSLFKVDSGANIERSDTFVLPAPGGDRTHEFFDAVFDSRVCP